MRNKWRCATAVLSIGCLALAACSSSGSSGGSSGPIKVGLVVPSSGSSAVFSKAVKEGWNYAAAEVNAKGGVDGRKVQIVTKDTDGNPSTSVTAAKQAVSRDGVGFLAGLLSSEEVLAVNSQLSNLNVLDFNSLAQANTLTTSRCTANAFQMVQTNSMLLAGVVAALKTIPGQKWALQSVDDPNGRQAADVMAKALKAAGRSVVVNQFSPDGTQDYGTAISKIKSSGADALFTSEDGSNAIAFVNQAQTFGLFRGLKAKIGLNTLLEPLFPVIGKKFLGSYNTVNYNPSETNALNQSFVKGFTAKYHEAPYFVSATSYTAAQVLFAAIKKAKSTDAGKVRKALSGGTFNTIYGPLTVRAGDNQLMLPTYIGVLVPSGSTVKFKIVKEVPASTTTAKASSQCHLT